MTFWLDAQLSPYLASWMARKLDVEAKSVRELGLRDAKDREIFLAAREADAVVMTKDSDFLVLLDQLGPPPRILWLTLGNTSNAYLKGILSEKFTAIEGLLLNGEPLVELSDEK